MCINLCSSICIETCIFRYVKAEYLRQLQIIAPEYLSECYKAVIDQNGVNCNVILKVSPYDSTEPGLKYCMDSKKEVNRSNFLLFSSIVKDYIFMVLI